MTEETHKVEGQEVITHAEIAGYSFLYIRQEGSNPELATVLRVTVDGELLLNGEPCEDKAFLAVLRAMALTWKASMIAKAKGE